MLTYLDLWVAIDAPSGTTDNYEAFCQWYERRIEECGGIDLQILGIGSDGHIAFNEPSSSLGSRTRIKTLAKQTIDDNARFFDQPADVPIYAITMGVGTILEARRIMLLASGTNKADAIAAAIEGPVTSMITASALQLHRDTICYLDRPAAGSSEETSHRSSTVSSRLLPLGSLPSTRQTLARPKFFFGLFSARYVSRPPW